MGKRIIFLLVIIFIIGLAIIGYLLRQDRKGLLTDPYKAISGSAGIVIETADLKSILNSVTSGKGIFGELGSIREMESFWLNLKFFSDLADKPAIKPILNKGSAIISFQTVKTGKIEALLSIALPGEISYRQLKESLRSSGFKNLIEKKDKDKIFLKLPYMTGGKADTLQISIVSGLLLCSSSKELLDDAVMQTYRDTDVRNMPGFTKVLMASGKKEDKLFVIFTNLVPFLYNIIGINDKDLSGKVADMAGAAEWDIYINDGGVVLSGYIESTDSDQVLFRFKSSSTREFHTYKILPSSTALFETLVFQPDSHTGNADSSKSKGTIVLATGLKKYSGGEVTRAYINIKDNQIADNTLIIYSLSDPGQVKKIFFEASPTNQKILYFQPDDQIKIPVYKTTFKGLSDFLVPGFAKRSDDTYFTFYDNYLISGSSFTTISRLLYDNLLKKTLANDATYRDFESSLPSRSGYTFYCVPSLITEFLSDFISKDLVIALNQNINSLRKVQSAGYQLAASNGMIYNSLSVRFRAEPREESTTEWETLLDTVAGIKPFFFTNHLTGAKEIFIQDLKNNLYLINTAGRVLWKVPLNEKITGTVYMIDYYRNGKFQLLFSGKNFLHLLDRNGNYVERYPVKLRSPATNSLTLADYENNLSYRLFIAGEDKLIYSYDKTGNVIKGWAPFKTDGTVKSEIVYFKVSGKDYLIAADESTIYLLDRTGNRRVTLKEPVTKARGSALRYINASEPYIVCSAPDGTLQQVYLDGHVIKFIFKSFSDGHSFDIFDVDGDGFGEYVFIDRGKLYIYRDNKSEMFTRDFGGDDLGGPINFIFSASDRKIGVFDINKDLIYLIGKDGKTMNGFPLRGASMFSIGKLSDKSGWHLIVGGTDKFLYNYKLDTETK